MLSDLYIGVKFTPNDKFNVDLMASFLNQDNKIINKAGFVYYNSDTRTIPYDSFKCITKRSWRASTVPISKDGSLILILAGFKECEEWEMSDTDISLFDLKKVTKKCG